jgi:hypothetical protein
MALLDLQAMDIGTEGHHRPGHSANSKHCFGGLSTLSLIFC